MKRVIIDRAALDAGEPAIQVVYEGGERENCRQVYIEPDGPGTACARVIQFDRPGLDGTRVEVQIIEGVDIHVA